MPWLIKAVFLVTPVVMKAKGHPVLVKTILLLLMLVAAPVFRSASIGWEKLIILGLITAFWTLTLMTAGYVKYLFLAVTCVIITVSVLYFGGILGHDFHWDGGRTVMVDAAYGARINSLAGQSLYLPYKLRPVVFGGWSVLLDNLGRTLTILWFDNLLSSIGVIASVLLIFGLLSKKSPVALLLIFAGASACAISRNPDTSTVFLLISPPLFSLAVDGAGYIFK